MTIRSLSEGWLWFAWLFGPAVYLWTCVIYYVLPHVSGDRGPGPDLRYACFLVLGHLASAAVITHLVVAQRVTGLMAEKCLLGIYWLAAAVVFGPVMLNMDLPERGRALSGVSFRWIMAAAACGMPSIRIGRLALQWVGVVRRSVSHQPPPHNMM